MTSFNNFNNIGSGLENHFQESSWLMHSNPAQKPMRAITKRQVFSDTAPQQMSDIRQRPILGAAKGSRVLPTNFSKSSISESYLYNYGHESYPNEKETVRTSASSTWREKIQQAHLANKLANKSSSLHQYTNDHSINVLNYQSSHSSYSSIKHDFLSNLEPSCDNGNTPVYFCRTNKHVSVNSDRYGFLSNTEPSLERENTAIGFNQTNRHNVSVNSDHFKLQFAHLRQSPKDYANLNDQSVTDTSPMHLSLPKTGLRFDDYFKSFFLPSYTNSKEHSSDPLLKDLAPELLHDSCAESVLRDEALYEDASQSTTDPFHVGVNEESASDLDKVGDFVDYQSNDDYVQDLQYVRQRKPLRIVDPASNTEIFMPVCSTFDTNQSISPLTDELNQQDQLDSASTSGSTDINQAEGSLADWFSGSLGLPEGKSTTIANCSQQPRERRRLQIIDPASNEEIVVENRNSNPLPVIEESGHAVDQKRMRKRLVIVDPVSNKEVTVHDTDTQVKQ